MGILTKSKNGFYAIPAVVSAFFPGIGQLIKRQYAKGLVFLGLSFVWGYLMMVPGLLPFGWLISFIITVAAWGINVLDAGFNSVGQRY